MVPPHYLTISNNIANDRANLATVPAAQLVGDLQIGDLLFIRVAIKPYHALADVTGGWTNHVGVVTHVDGDDPVIAESTFPFSRTTTFSKFIERSERGRLAVARLKNKLTSEQKTKIQIAAHRRKGTFYDTSFNVHSKRQFCSRYAHEILQEATGIAVGKAESLRELATNYSNIKVWIIKLWFFGFVPWALKTMTPISLLRSADMQGVFYGHVKVRRYTPKRGVRQLTEQLALKLARFAYSAAANLRSHCLRFLPGYSPRITK